MNFLQQHLQETADHYARMALTAGWLDYARHRVGQMQKDKMYKGLGDMVKERMEELKNANHSGLPTSGLVPEPIQGQALGSHAQVQDDLQGNQLLGDQTANEGVETQRGRPTPHLDLFDA